MCICTETIIAELILGSWTEFVVIPFLIQLGQLFKHRRAYFEGNEAVGAYGLTRLFVEIAVEILFEDRSDKALKVTFIEFHQVD